eukprot:GHUV01041196.1.p2 GENE.GHUV01041196.1~~GHUV01041196.1.p2  ORF type:complete len:100 (+),score=14.80 GHUV01041196.1:38-337(+)
MCATVPMAVRSSAAAVMVLYESGMPRRVSSCTASGEGPARWLPDYCYRDPRSVLAGHSAAPYGASRVLSQTLRQLEVCCGSTLHHISDCTHHVLHPSCS